MSISMQKSLVNLRFLYDFELRATFSTAPSVDFISLTFNLYVSSRLGDKNRRK